MSRGFLAHCVRRSSVAWTFAGLLAAAALVGPVSAVIVTPNTPSNAVTIHELTADGDAVPRARITGAATGLNQPFGVALDRDRGEIFVTSLFGDSVTVFRRSDDGDVAPVRTIVGPATQLDSPIGVVYDAVNEELIVRNFAADANGIVVFPRAADGNVAPLRTLGGNLTEIDPEAVDVAVDSVNDELFVSSRDTDGMDAILVFPRLANGNVAPLRKIQGLATNLSQPYGIVVDVVNDELLVTNATADARVLTFARDASGNVAPIRQIDPMPPINNLTGIDLDLLRDEIVVASQSSNRLDVFSRTANGTTAPLRTIAGPSTELASPALLELDAESIFSDGFED